MARALVALGANLGDRLATLRAAVRALDELGIGPDLQRLTATTSGSFQILTDKLRLSLPAEPARRYWS